MSKYAKTLRGLPIESLILLAQRKGLPVSDSPHREVLIEAFEQLSPASLEELLSTPARFELEAVTQASVKAEDFHDSIAEIDNRFDEKLELRFQSIDQLKWLFTAVGASVALLVAIGSGFGLKQLFDFQAIRNQHERMVAEKALNTEQAHRNISSTLAVATLSLMADSRKLIISVSDQGLGRMSLVGSRNRADYQRFQVAQATVAELLKLAEDIQPPIAQTSGQSLSPALNLLQEYRATLAFLQDSFQAAAILNSALTSRSSEAEEALDNVMMVLQNIAVPDSSNALIRTYERQVDAWRHTAIGIVELRRLRSTPNTETAEKALRAFSDAIAMDGTQPQPYAYTSMVYKTLFDIARRDNSADLAGHLTEMLELLSKAQRSLDTALAQSPDSSFSRLLNNRAFYYLKEAELLHEVGGEAEDIYRALGRAKSALKVAETSFPASPVVFTTLAEIRCFMLHLRYTSGNFYEYYGDSAAREQEFQEIISLLSRATQLGYRHHSDMSIEQLFFYFPIYKYIDHLEADNWRQRLSDALNLTA